MGASGSRLGGMISVILLRLFWALIRITSMVGATALSLEGLVAVDADVVRLRRGDLNALSELRRRTRPSPTRRTGHPHLWWLLQFESRAIRHAHP